MSSEIWNLIQGERAKTIVWVENRKGDGWGVVDV